MKILLLIDGLMVQVEQGTPIIRAAKKVGIAIPTLCYHEALKPYGACRLCTVEVVQNGQRKIVTSCTYPCEAGMEVLTNTDRVRTLRRTLVELLLAHYPEVPVVLDMAKRMDVITSRFRKREAHECILCGLCVRFCEEVVGSNAIGLSNKGIEREVSTPFKNASDACIGCGSCKYICPSSCIEMVRAGETADTYIMKKGGLSINPCQYEYQCQSCDTDRLFMKEARNAISKFRSKLAKKTII